ncbi:MAG: HK97 gp10 family phage protein [Planctomycetota bacterium]|nr:MAG: HK97 gp10 family phage protein [Planctomycetota bacterium]
MSASVTWIGMKELQAALARLAPDLTEMAAAVVVESAERAAATIRNAYPDGDTGNLRKGVRVALPRDAGPFTVKRVVRSSARHALLFETGTQTRRTARGYNRGFMPGANIFVPVVVAARREMLEDLVAIVEEAGLDVRR